MTAAAALNSGKREQNKVANRLAILDAARAVFGEMGFEAATVRDIVRRSGLSVGAFYNYYRSKEEVFEALADDGARRFRPILKASFEKGAGFEASLKSAVHAYFAFVADEHESWQAQRPGGERQPHLHSHTPEMQSVFDEVRDYFAAIMERGDAPRTDVTLLAAGSIGLVREIADVMLARRPVDVDGCTDFAVAMILGGLRGVAR